MFTSVEDLLKAAAGRPLWRAVLEDDLRDRDVTEEHSLAQMEKLWQAMKAAVADYDPARRSASGLTGGAAAGSSGAAPQLRQQTAADTLPAGRLHHYHVPDQREGPASAVQIPAEIAG